MVKTMLKVKKENMSTGVHELDNLLGGGMPQHDLFRFVYPAGLENVSDNSEDPHPPESPLVELYKRKF